VALTDWWTLAEAQLAAAMADPRQIAALLVAAVAAVLVVIGAIVKTIMPLRWLLVASNACFVLYGALYPSYMVLLLHATLLPINVWRALEMLRLTRRVLRAADAGDTSGVWLKSYMKRKRLAKGSVVFAKGDTADHLYMLVEGDMELVESGRRVEPGRVFGEIAFFAPDRRRTGTARCRTACTVLRIDETTFRQVYYQDPSFGFEIVRLITSRLTADVHGLENEVARLKQALAALPAQGQTGSPTHTP
jgi:CRP-like cAMP-binding protein